MATSQHTQCAIATSFNLAYLQILKLLGAEFARSPDKHCTGLAICHCKHVDCSSQLTQLADQYIIYDPCA